MISRKFFLSILVMALVVAGSMLGSNKAFADKKKKHRHERRARVVGPPSLSLAADPVMLRNCEAALVHLVATASSPEGRPLRYKWTTNGGRLDGRGPNTTWDLSGAQPGVYQAVVEVDDGRDRDCVAFSTATVVVTGCPPERPVLVCPNVSVTCPDTIAENQPVTFTATVTGGTPNVQPSYNWTVSAGGIVSGQGTTSITVDTAGLAGQTVRATLDVGGFNMPCPASCSVSLPIPRNPRKFDEYPNIARNDEKARLDNYAIQLQSEPGARGYVIVHPPARARRGEAEARAGRITDYLVNSRGLDPSRVVTTIDGPSSDWLFELWIVPEGAPPPVPVVR
jgi:PKD-like domain